MSKKSVLLLGNGINNINNKFAWQELIEELIDHIGARGQIHIRDKPFPLLYEEIIAEAVKNRGFKEKEIKDFISKKISNLKKNSLHEEIMKLGFQNILTTNYDYNLEKVKQNDTTKLKNNGAVKERTYSLFRHTNIDLTNIWHIHGGIIYLALNTLSVNVLRHPLHRLR
ncbi:MAG: hypothetical protein GTO45_14625 [Candidatus Aminicenantes bacterium]|nr:hypothetical protein [Candidatus Aminicenantes bacterium]NIM79989.1 hypothetical protein [Candidatus Aminicenantes bacterium]NIN19342.1 hypothetical protein [Candidatus Aminicenantes bacterium]NIN43241.1 hypothetical protein [Candidatus Aminicenantes bacterium]NIN85983.1 hypothetical protein [Candidatus Aminicenantes bacterium]